MQTQDEAAGTGAGAVGIARLGNVGNQVPSDSDEHAMDIDTELRIEQDIANEPRAGCAKDEAWEVNGEAGSQHESVPGGEAESSGSSEASTTGRGGGGHVDDEASASNEDDGNNEPTALPQPPPILPSAHIPGTLFRDPPGKWFKRRDEDGAGPQQQMLQHANSAGHAFKAACDYWAPDKSSGTGHKTVKGYASYPDAGSFLNIALLPSDVRFLYELIPEGAACKLHLDIEWQGHGGCDGDDAGRRMQDLLLLLAKDIEAKLGIVPRFVVLDGSRPAGDGGSKHSYHVICPNVVFASNTGGMKAFVNDFIKANEVHQALLFFYDKGNRKCVIDQTIYTKNRCFRTELSSKLTDKTATCLRRVRLSQDGAWHDVAGLTSNDYLEALVTHIDDSFDRCSIIPDPTPASQPDGSGGKKRCLGPSSSSGGRGQAGPRDSVVVARLQELVDAKGCAGCVVVGPLSNSMGTLGCSGGFQCKNNGKRECLVTPGAVHRNNNCFLTIDSSGTVKYTCHSSECRSVGAVEIGRLGNAAPNGKSGDVDRQGPSGGRVSYDKDAMVNNDEDAMVDDAKLCIEQDIDTEQSAPRDKVESSDSEASNTGKGGGAAEKRKRKHTDDEASASDKDKGDDDDSEGGGSNSDSGGDDGYDDDSEGDDDDDDDDSEGGDGGGDSSEGDDDSEGGDGGGNSSEGNDDDDNSEDGNGAGNSSEGNDDDNNSEDGNGGGNSSEGNDDDDNSEDGNGGNDDDRGDGDDDDDDDDDMEEGDMRDAEVLTGVSFPCYNRGSKIDDLLITEVESLVTFFEDPDQNRCRVLTATASDFHCNRVGRHAEGRRSQTDPIKTIHLEPPVDKGDERPIDYRLELYVGRLKRSNMRVGKILGVCQAIRDACEHNDDVHSKALMSLFRKTQKISKRDPRLTLDASNSSLAGTAYALPLLRHWYVEDNPSQEGCELDGYPAWKARVELRYIKNESPFLFLQLDADGKGGFNTVDESAIRGLHRNKHYYEHRIPKKKKQNPSQDGEDAPAYDVVKLPFVSKWLEDPQILTSTKICCDPSRPYGLVPVSGGVAYNTWPGFEAAKLPSVPESVEQEAMECFYNHILKCVQGVEVAVYLMDYFANIFQRPWAKTKTAILLQGLEGCGKGTIFDTIRAVMGNTVSFQTGNPTQHLFSRFSTGFKNKAFVQIDEAKDMFVHDDLIKNVITIDTMEFEDKHAKPYKLDLHANIVVTTNNRHPLKISPNDRRWMAVKCAEGHAQDTSYFGPLYTFLQKKETLRGLYQGFMKRDIQHITNFQSCRPKTDYYRQCAKAFAPLHTRFLSGLALKILGDGQEREDIPSTHLFKRFQQWARDANYQFTYNLNSFSDLMQEFMKHENCGISKKRTKKCWMYYVDAAGLKMCLEKREEFDEYANDAAPAWNWYV